MTPDASPDVQPIAPPVAARRELPGSDKTVLPGARSMGPVNPSEKITASIWLKPDAPPTAPDAIAAFATSYGLTTTPLANGKIDVQGDSAAMEAAFGTRLTMNSYSGGTYRARSGTLSLPADIVDSVQAVLGLDDRPVATSHLRRAAAEIMPQVVAAAKAYFTPTDLVTAYNAAGLGDGTGRCIGIVALGGGVIPAKIAKYFTDPVSAGGLGFAVAPQLKVVLTGGAQNRPDGPNGADGETGLDICMSGGFAQGVTVVLYIGPNTDAGYAGIYSAAINDTVNNPDVISSSWGGSERNYTAGARAVMDSLFQQGSAKGISFTAAAGDDGSSDGNAGNNVDYPASSPWVLAVGGTRKTATSETVWNDQPGGGATGGGFSQVYGPPSYQAGHGFASLSVPDVASVAAPSTGVLIDADGSRLVIGGTSAGAPLWAGLIARLCSSLGKRVGLIHPQLYAARGAGCVDITIGNNGSFKAGPGIDQCTGWGVPDGMALLAMLGGVAPPPPPPPPTCPAGQHWDGTQCVPDAVTPPPAGTTTITLIVPGTISGAVVNGTTITLH